MTETQFDTQGKKEGFSYKEISASQGPPNK